MGQLCWLNWAQDRGQCLVVLDTVMNVLDFNKVSNFRKNEMGGACGAYVGGERCAQGSGWKT